MPSPVERHCDILIVGGGVGGCAAAMAAASLRLKVILTEETRWIGGQFTAQGVPPDEHPWIEEFGCTARYRAFRDAVREWYRVHRALTPEAMKDGQLNPGGGWVSRLCAEPAAYWSVISDMLPKNVEVLLRRKPVRGHVDGDQVKAVTLWNLESDTEEVVSASYVLDATELGDLLPLCGAEYVSGAESKRDTGEPNAVEGEAELGNVQGLTWCFAMAFGEPHPLSERPSDYDKWKGYKPSFWPGPLLGFDVLHAHTGEPRTLPLFREDGDWYALFPYRQIVNPAVHTNARFPVTLVNWPQNDYFEASIIDVDPPGSKSAFPGATGPVSEARLKSSIQLSLSLSHWLRTEAPRHDGGTGYPECAPADLFPAVEGVPRGFAPYPYIRESRRTRARFTVLEQHVAAYTNPGRDRAVEFKDSVGVGAYRIDLHPSTSGANMIDTSTVPFQIPLGSLIPMRVRNLLPACKNIGTTHITNGCYRLHPVEWNIGEAAGILAAFCLLKGLEPAQVYESPELTLELQDLLVRQGIELSWPDVELRAL